MPGSLAHLLAPHTAADPGRSALLADGRDWTYPEPASTAATLAAAMRADGLRGERVALFLPNSAETVLTYLACSASGAVATPLNSRYAPPELERRCAGPGRGGSSRTPTGWTGCRRWTRPCSARAGCS